MVASADVAGSGVQQAVTGEPAKTVVGQVLGPEGQEIEELVVAGAGFASPLAASRIAGPKTVALSESDVAVAAKRPNATARTRSAIDDAVESDLLPATADDVGAVAAEAERGAVVAARGRLGVGDDLVTHVNGADGLMASLGKDGILDLYIKRGPTTPSGGQMFNEAMSAFGSSVKGVRGTWFGGGELASNFDAFKAAVRAGSSPAEAAFKTFTGHMASKHGFATAKVITNTESKVVVEFFR
jgi:hypothetical protein